ncbi:Elicitin [Phytophthora cactorum]|nr:Elicitin [Phytophthora cactorum]
MLALVLMLLRIFLPAVFANELCCHLVKSTLFSSCLTNKAGRRLHVNSLFDVLDFSDRDFLNFCQSSDCTKPVQTLLRAIPTHCLITYRGSTRNISRLFDFLVAVGYPILMVIYCLSTFGLDHAKIAINFESFSCWSLQIVTLLDSMTQCPCLAIIGGDLVPKTFESWLKPEDVTLKVIELATTGDLRTIQLTNRYFPALPDELRRCGKMQHL